MSAIVETVGHPLDSDPPLNLVLLQFAPIPLRDLCALRDSFLPLWIR